MFFLIWGFHLHLSPMPHSALPSEPDLAGAIRMMSLLSDKVRASIGFGVFESSEVDA